MVENLADAFGLTLIGGEGFLECREKSEEGAKLAHRILVGSKEKVMDNFSGIILQIGYFSALDIFSIICFYFP